MQLNNHILLTRLTSNSKQTTGYLVVHDYYKTHANFVTIELPWLNNKQNISCIPAGSYKAKLITSSTFGTCIKILDVPNRSGILIHFGNYYTNSKGCILVGSKFAHINKDRLIDITNSKKALKLLTSYFNASSFFNITIQNAILKSNSG